MPRRTVIGRRVIWLGYGGSDWLLVISSSGVFGVSLIDGVIGR